MQENNKIEDDGSGLFELAQYIQSHTEKAVQSYEILHNELTLKTSKLYIHDFLVFLRDDPQCLFKQLIDICGVDYPDREERFDVVYHLLSLVHNIRIRIKLTTDESTLVPTVSDIYSAANWAEREVWDMYGVMFSDHPDHRRILTDYGFEGHPQRKDFPLTGFVELSYDEDEKRVVYKPVEFPQDFRVFDNLSPWQGMTDVQFPASETGVFPEKGYPHHPSSHHSKNEIKEK